MRTQDIAILAAVGIVGYGLVTSDFFRGLGKVGTGAGEAATGLGAGISTAGRGLGGGIGMAGTAAGLSVQDILGITALLRPVGAVGVAGVSEVERWAEGRELEHEQELEIDVAAHERAKQELVAIQAEQERKAAEEEAERKRLIEEEKTQYVEFATTLPEKALAGFKYLGAGALAAWAYSPMGLLTKYIQGQVSIEEEAAPQQSAPISTGGGGAVTTISNGTTIKKTYYSAPAISPIGTASYEETKRRYAIQEETGVTPAPTIYLKPAPEPEPEPEKPWWKFW